MIPGQQNGSLNRQTQTAMHRQVAEDHGFTAIADVDILDADGSMELPVEGGTRLEKNLVGAHFGNYDSYIVLSHFKGHAMAGFGGAIKNISIGLSSKEGKCLIHTAGASNSSPWGGDQTGFMESMAEGSETLKNRGESRDGLHTLEHAEEIGLGTRTYELVSLDE